ncbi:heat shock 70 kDa protein 12B-like [Mytilus californianus]|uniref:heat shock 70 kDa protein 12B-like n=1 Tax=Mytilus californianus TaxID=6549 RepID=UPI0022461582|nr:heat shock 70 kDa protein 12B-like [Mytilus californianus]XP_052077327.1 heat shock 70 kDa protein 12B-like [Mytilus californianus]
MYSEQKNKMLVAAIDIGTTFSACAYSLQIDFETDSMHIHTNTWTSISRALMSIKVPTAVLLDKSQKFLAFGYDAEEQYSELVLDEEHHDYYYFCGFKMLRHELKHTVQTMIKDDNGIEMPALEIFSLVIKNLKGHLLESFKSVETGIVNDDIHWVLTVPAIWTESGKQFMREAANKAGISGEHLSLCLKPDAATLLCQHLLTDKIQDEDVVGNACTSSEKGATFMVLDLGDETAEITCHQKDADGTLLQLQTPSGGPWVGPSVDRAFNQLLIKIVGAPHLRKFQKENKFKAEELLIDFKMKSTKITNESIERVTLRLPVSLLESFEKDTEEKIQDVLKQTAYEDKMTWCGDKLRMEANFFRALFNEAKSNLIEHVKSLLTKSHLKDVSTLLMVGSFSESLIMQSAVKDAYPGMTVFVPPEPGIAVLKGAVIYGHRIIARLPKKEIN